MARVLVVTSSPLFVEGGHLVIARALVRALREGGYEAELLVTPQNRFGRQGAAYLATWLTDVGLGADDRPVDHIVSLRYPSYAVRHRSHSCWLNHRMREYYDRWPEFAAGLGWPARQKERLRRAAIHAVDRFLLRRNVGRVYAQSRTIQSRLQRESGIRSEVLYPPPPQRKYRCDGYGGEILAVSRLTRLKRLDLAIRAIAEPASHGARLVVAGYGEQLASLERLSAELGVDDRVRFVGPLDDQGLVEQLAGCRAVLFPPFDEDFGLVTVEAFAAAKPVVTCTDSGGPAELVRDGIEGFVCDPTPASLAVAIGRLIDNAAEAERMGRAGLEAARRLSWEHTVAALVAM